MTAVALLSGILLVVHQRHSIGSCLCGWSDLGKSHAEHQVEMLDEAGLLSGSFSRKPWFPAAQPPKDNVQVEVITADGRILPSVRGEGLWVMPAPTKGYPGFFGPQVAYWRPVNG